MKGQLPVAEAVHLLNHESAKHLLGRHCLAPGIWIPQSANKIGVHEFDHLRESVKDVAHRLEFAGVPVIKMLLDNR